MLREPKDRLQHLLELESGAKPGNIQSTPPELTDLFFAVGQLCRDVDTFVDSHWIVEFCHSRPSASRTLKSIFGP